jgi:streptomycin 6-kinase
LLHGDLHHYNVLRDSQRGWLAIDPKGVIGEIEYELGAGLRNPCERPEVFTRPAVIERRVKQFAGKLPINQHRALAWAFSEAVLAAIWCVEDGSGARGTSPEIELAQAILPMLRR